MKRLRILELGSWLAAPGAAALFADLGADVIKIEPTAGDPGRNFVAALGGEATGYAPSFALLNRGKRSIVLNLADEDDRTRFDALLAEADVFITNLRGGSLRRLALDPLDTTRRQPRLIYASITGLGLRGDESEEPAYDVGGFWARSGLMSQMQVPGAPLPSPTGGYGDIITSLALYSGIMSALYRREQTGRGGLVETSLAQTGAFVMGGDLAVESVRGNLKGQRPRERCRTPLVNSYTAACGRSFFLTGIEAEKHFLQVVHAIGRTDLLGDQRFTNARAIRANSAELIAIFDEAFRKETLDVWRARFAEESVCWQAVATPAEVLADPQLQANDVFSPIWNGEGDTQMATSPFSLDRQAKPPMRAPDRPGAQDDCNGWRED